MILSTLKNYIEKRYNHPQNPFPADQKSIFRENILNMFYEINNCPQAVNLYKDIVYRIVAVDFDQYRELFYNLLSQDINSNIMASIYFCSQVAKVYEWIDIKGREAFDVFISDFFPKIENLIENIMSNYNEQTAKLLF